MNLEQLAEKYKTDKLVHGYCPYYERHAPPRDESFSILEIGIYEGGSLKMWKDYFSKAEVFGVDINENFLISNEERITCYLTDVTSKAFWDKTTIPNLKMIVDDGSHKSADIIEAFVLLWPRLESGGWYVIEDLFVQWDQEYGGGPGPSPAIELINTLMHGVLRYENPEFHVYNEIVFLKKR